MLMSIGRRTLLIGQFPLTQGSCCQGTISSYKSLGSEREPKDGFIEGQSTHVQDI